jgi:hypothetical protein
MKNITHYSFVYKWTHLPTGKWYIGCRTAKGCHPDDGYITSSKLVNPLIQANPEEWQREILHIGTPEEILNLEVVLLKESDAKNNSMSYNQHNGDGKFTRTGVAVPLETRLKQSESIKKIHPGKGKPSPNKGKIASEETRKKQSLAKIGKKRPPFSQETKEKIGAAKKGTNHPNFGKPLSNEHKQKLRDAFIGKAKILVTCPHCGKVGGGGAMVRHHFDNCKYKENK